MTRAEILKDIKDHPDDHRHPNLNSLLACCFVDGAIDLGLQEAHQRYAPLGSNGGRACDVLSGPCSCGAWH